MNITHTILPGAAIPEGYFDDINITFIQSKVAEILKQEYAQHIHMSRANIIRIMESVLSERRENIPRMNQRVVMTLVNDFRVHQLEVNKRLNLEKNYVVSQQLYNPISQVAQYDRGKIKLTSDPDYKGNGTVGGTLRFYFT